MPRFPLALASVLLLSACSGGSHAKSGSPTPVPAVSAAAGGLDASGILSQFTAAGLPVGAVDVYTAASDPTHLLGRRHEYTSKANFIDTGHGGQAAGSRIEVANGGSIEVFASAADANARGRFVTDVPPGASRVAEADFTSGNVLMRLGPKVSFGEERLYMDALTKLTHAPVLQVIQVAATPRP